MMKILTFCVCRHGYIPMDRDDLNYLREESREVDVGFPPCKCSNCAPKEAEYLKARMTQINTHNFDAILENPKEVPGPLPVKKPKQKKSKRWSKPKDWNLTSIEIKALDTLDDSFNNFFLERYRKPQLFLPEHIFGRFEAEAIARRQV